MKTATAAVPATIVDEPDEHPPAHDRSQKNIDGVA